MLASPCPSSRILRPTALSSATAPRWPISTCAISSPRTPGASLASRARRPGSSWISPRTASRDRKRLPGLFPARPGGPRPLLGGPPLPFSLPLDPPNSGTSLAVACRTGSLAHLSPGAVNAQLTELPPRQEPLGQAPDSCPDGGPRAAARLGGERTSPTPARYRATFAGSVTPATNRNRKAHLGQLKISNSTDPGGCLLAPLPVIWTSPVVCEALPRGLLPVSCHLARRLRRPLARTRRGRRLPAGLLPVNRTMSLAEETHRGVPLRDGKAVPSA